MTSQRKTFSHKEELRLPPERDGEIWRHVSNGQSFHMHRHDELEINFIIKGRATYLLGDRKYELRRHDLVWLFPDQDHILLDQSLEYAMWILVFKPTLVERASTQNANRTLREANPVGDFCRRLDEASATRLLQLYQEIESAKFELDRYNSGLAYALTLSWAAHCATGVLSVSIDVHPCVEKAARLIQNSDSNFSLEILARHVGLSPARLSRLFKMQTGVSISEFRNRRRIEKFLDLYGAGRKLNLNEAALQAGFGSYPQFHRVFKSVVGYAPAQHRRAEKLR